MSKDFSSPFMDFKKQYLKFWRALPRQVSSMALREFRHNFKIQGYRSDFGVEFWKPIKKKKGQRRRTILVKSGRLRRSMRVAPDRNTARVITDVPYAKVHNEGFEGTVTVKKRKLKPTRKRGKTKTKIKNTFRKLGKGKRKMKIPARPFMKPGQPFFNVMEREVLKKLDQLFVNAKNL
jgi:phage gpG-like protein